MKGKNYFNYSHSSLVIENCSESQISVLAKHKIKLKWQCNCNIHCIFSWWYSQNKFNLFLKFIVSENPVTPTELVLKKELVKNSIQTESILIHIL